MKKLFGLAAVMIFLTGCGQAAKTDDQAVMSGDDMQKRELSVVASFYPLAYMAEQIGGEGVEVTNIVGAGDPHDYVPSPGDIRAMQDADVVLLQGADLEPWAEGMAAQLGKNGVKVVTVTDSLTLKEMEGGHDDHDENSDEHDDHGHEAEAHEGEDAHGHDDHGHDDHGHDDEHDDHTGETGKHVDEHGHVHGTHDPHTWLDPVLAQDMVDVIEEVMSAADKSQHETFEANATELKKRFADLDETYKAGLASCARDAVIISHDAFGYVADRYGFTAHGIAGLSTQDEPSAETLAELKAEAAEGVTHILTEENTAGRFAATLSTETGLGLLPINALASPDDAGTDFITRAEANLSTFKTALGCEVQ